MAGLVRLGPSAAPPLPEEPPAKRDQRQDDDGATTIVSVTVAVGPFRPRRPLRRSGAHGAGPTRDVHDRPARRAARGRGGLALEGEPAAGAGDRHEHSFPLLPSRSEPPAGSGSSTLHRARIWLVGVTARAERTTLCISPARLGAAADTDPSVVLIEGALVRTRGRGLLLPSWARGGWSSAACAPTLTYRIRDCRSDRSIHRLDHPVRHRKPSHGSGLTVGTQKQHPTVANLRGNNALRGPPLATFAPCTRGAAHDRSGH